MDRRSEMNEKSDDGTRRCFVARAIAALSLLILVADALPAQSDDFGMWYTISAEKKINKKWSVDIDTDFRTRNDSKTADRWTIGIGTSYKICKNLKAAASYTFLVDNNREKITYNDDGAFNNWRPSDWGTRHSLTLSLTGSIDIGRFSFSLRERWQYIYRPERTTERFDFDNGWWEDTKVRGKGKNVLRSRLKADYNIPKCKVDPYAMMELFNAWNLTKTRYTAGIEWKATKKHSFDMSYCYQNSSKSDDEGDIHYLCIGYKFKF